MCGIIGLLLSDENQHVNQLLFDGLTVLQHRGQDAAGMVTSEQCRLHLRKDNGLVKDVFQSHHMRELRGNVGLGHCRYPTAGSSSCAEAQPLYTNYPHGICVAHNGNLVNTESLTKQLVRTGRHVNTDSDSEVLLNIFAQNLMKQLHSNSADSTTFGNDKGDMIQAIFDAATVVMRECTGGYAALYLINGFGLVALRDPHGIRPLVYGTRMSPPVNDPRIVPGGRGRSMSFSQSTMIDYCIASESVAIDTLGFQLERDVGAGEVIFFDMLGNIHSRICHAQVHSPCIFEYVYFARPDSIMDGVSVYETRLKMGEKLAQKIMRLYPEHEIDVVIPIPDTSRTSALQAAYCLDRPFREGFIKNRYIARTFIMPGQATRKKSVRLKLNTIKSEFVGRNVLLVDDSIVRGTTANEIVQMARDAGAKKVFFSSAAPPIRYPNIYGIDIPTRQELIAYERDEAQIAEKIGCEWVVFQDLNDLQDCIWEVKNPQEMEEEKRCLASGMNTANAHPQTTVARLIPQFDTSCFSGTYVTGETISDFYFEQLYNKRNDVAKEQSKYGSPTKTISQMNGHSSSKSSSSHSIADADNDASTANGDTNAVVVVDEEALLRKPIPMTRQPSYDGCESINNDRRETNDGDHGSSCESLSNHQSNYDL